MIKRGVTIFYIEVVHRGGVDEDMRWFIIGAGVGDVEGTKQDRVRPVKSIHPIHARE